MSAPIPPSNSVITLQDVQLAYDSAAGHTQVLRGISLDIKAGETVAVIGPSGSGKSSLLMIMGGLERANAGRVALLGQDITSASEDQLADLRRDHIGIVFQDFHLMPAMNALENVAVPLELAGHSGAFELARAALAKVGLDHRLRHYPGQLSGGEQQRVALARALAVSPKLLLADEPTGNLDMATGRMVMDLLFAMAAAEGSALVLITHDPNLAARCSRQISLLDGTLATDMATIRAVS